PVGRLHPLLLVGDHAHRRAAESAHATDERLPVVGLVLVEPRIIEDQFQQVADVVLRGGEEGECFRRMARRQSAERRLTPPTDAWPFAAGRGGGPDHAPPPPPARPVVPLAAVGRGAYRP